jgi:hypothetical protein
MACLTAPNTSNSKNQLSLFLAPNIDANRIPSMGCRHFHQQMSGMSPVRTP